MLSPIFVLFLTGGIAESLLRVINFPSRKIGDVSIARLKEFAEEQGICLYDAILKAEEGGFPARLLNALSSFSSVIEALRKVAESGTVYDVLTELFTLTSIPLLLQAENTPESLARHENLQELLSMARDFSDHNPDGGSLGDFLENISLASDYEETQDSDNYVSLMTVHAAKGLEFPVVFVTGMEERLFPLNCYEPEELEEERRLFYVAMTRAKEKIFLSWAQSRYQYGQQHYCLRSVFISEIDSSIVQTESGMFLSDRSVKEKPLSGLSASPRGFHQKTAEQNVLSVSFREPAEALHAPDSVPERWCIMLFSVQEPFLMFRGAEKNRKSGLIFAVQERRR